MIVDRLDLDGVRLIRWAPAIDGRGLFARLHCEDTFVAAGLPARFEQMSLSRNTRRGTLRGMHYQAEPFAEAKLVRCVRGAIFDVALDLRPSSPTLGRWVGRTLSAEEGSALFVPPGFAHGFQTLMDDTDVLYQITPAFRPGHAEGVRWSDPAFAICWPIDDPILNARDDSYADWRP